MLLEIFEQTNIRYDKEKLIKYFEFCTKNNIGKKVKGVTSLHHILPKAKNLPFMEYSNLIKNVWNGVHLTYENHYIAHSLLADAVDNFVINSIWFNMNNKEYKLGRIQNPKDILGAKKYQELMESKDKSYQLWLEEKVTLEDGTITTNKLKRNQSISNTKQNKEWKENIGMNASIKRLETMGSDFKSMGKKIAQIRMENGSYVTGAKKMRETLNKEYIGTDGNVTTILKENGKRISEGKKGKGMGKNNPNAKVIKIYDNENEEVYICEGNFKVFCEVNNLPFTALKTSYLKEEPIYETLANNVIPRIKSKGWYQYKGWYARIED